MKILAVVSILLALSIISASYVFADLSAFPDNFLNEGNFDGYIVVGKESTASDVISQNIIALKIASYIESRQSGIVKLDNEVDLSENLVLIGSPCINKLSAELMRNPVPCDKSFDDNEAYIRYYEKDGKEYVLAAGKDDKLTRVAAEYLANFEENELSGREIVLSGDGEVISSETESPESFSSIEDSSSESLKDGKSNYLKLEGSIPLIKEDKGIFTKIWDWIRGLFK